jgi:hypothetical protein
MLGKRGEREEKAIQIFFQIRRKRKERESLFSKKIIIIIIIKFRIK